MGKKLLLTVNLVRVFFLRMHCCTPIASCVERSGSRNVCNVQQRACNLMNINQSIYEALNSKHLPLLLQRYSQYSGYCWLFKVIVLH